jgi:hypothetical protein
MKRIWMNKGYIAKLTTTTIGGIYALLGFIGILVPLDEILSDMLPIWARFVISLEILLAAWFICFMVVAIILSLRKRFEIVTANNGHKLYLQYGDVFNENEVIRPDERRNIIIPVNRCFDTVVDNHLVSEQTLHGIAFKKLYAMGTYTEESLNITIQQLLSHKEYENIAELHKPAGNRKRFPVGTVVDLPGSDKEHFLLWALSTFDSDLKAHTTMQEYALAVQKLVEACNEESEGFPVVLPLVGTGLSRTKKEQQDVISYLLNAFRVNKSEINCDIHIVVREDIKNEIAIMNIK